MKKTVALLAAVAMLFAVASCDNTPAENSSAADTSSTVSVSTPSTPVSSDDPVSVAPPVVEENKNLVMTDGATYIDMNTGKADGDEGYIAYYSADITVNNAFDGNISTGWQTEENFGSELTEDEVNATGTPELYYQSTLEASQWFLKPVYADGEMWLGVTFAEAVTANQLVISWESGSIADTYENGGYKIEITTDGEAWTAFDGVTVTRGEADTTNNAVTEIADFDATEIKGIRVVLLKASTKYAPKIWEFELYAPEETETSSENASGIIEE